MLARSLIAIRELIAALRAIGHSLNCWTRWGDSAIPMNSGAVARHQVHEAAIHAYDSQLAIKAPHPIPTSNALDGIAEFIDLNYGTAGAWPYASALIGLHAIEGWSWLLELKGPEPAAPENVAGLSGSASDLLLTMHGRLGLERLKGWGDCATIKRVLARPNLD